MKVFSTLVHMATFAVIAMVAGYYLPQTYYQYFDKTVYYQIDVPIPVNGAEFKACDSVPVSITRRSLIDGQGDSIINLSLVRDGNNTRERIARETRTVSITQGEGTVITKWALPCGIPIGEYYFEGTIKYQVRGIDKYTPFVTELFDVKE